ncbi:hypothetical protein [Halonotius roseus]|uniref:DUF1102 domain-containing protein n=1 Tax=Halonotius roseus TaxID=2511997 RepID=A0A544QLS5_9EURY|nr:hypothetical protein [Halonotius roseus]TQQ79551.1 hypothetical protein EWF95_11100 [Halonotius roseus]
MQLTRRNTIIGLGTVAAGAGIISGSGAFDSVEANRSFEVSVTGDGGALLGLNATNDTIAGEEPGGAGGNEVIFFEINDSETGGDASLNEDSTTRFNDAFSITNNNDQTVLVSILLPSGMEGVSFTLADERALYDQPGSSPTDLVEESVELTTGESISLDLQIDTTEDGGYVEPAEGEPYQITIRAVSVQ